MATVLEVLDRIKNLDVHREVKTTLGETRNVILDLNQDQMIHGRRADDSDITPEYTHFTRLSKIEKGRDPDVVTLYDTGEFYNAMFVDVGSDELEIDSTDYKSDDLQAKYGAGILGLSKGSKELYLDEAFPVFKSKIEESLKLEMK